MSREVEGGPKMGFSVRIRTTIQGKHDGVRANSTCSAYTIGILQAKIDPKRATRFNLNGKCQGKSHKTGASNHLLY